MKSKMIWLWLNWKRKRLPAKCILCRKPLFIPFSMCYVEANCIKIRFYTSVKWRRLVKPVFRA